MFQTGALRGKKRKIQFTIFVNTCPEKAFTILLSGGGYSVNLRTHCPDLHIFISKKPNIFLSPPSSICHWRVHFKEGKEAIRDPISVKGFFYWSSYAEGGTGRTPMKRRSSVLKRGHRNICVPAVCFLLICCILIKFARCSEGHLWWKREA